MPNMMCCMYVCMVNMGQICIWCLYGEHGANMVYLRQAWNKYGVCMVNSEGIRCNILYIPYRNDMLRVFITIHV